ncbi:hypothetical protein Phum_PHUM535260 [Pediculus humanus corporis]|uniref:Uncharacterized protein n=1 Tax=Pediculus humanus subsp. corporis TaxID=121224 RepID=E0VZK7_PEDHC|nr:uncharacterized protein Phum_PHUM535260 [Pediculus humanus corporis]EEB18813.1 hypothetical protein Phum_PHUM535260 [Pediculus humanus corporis]
MGRNVIQTNLLQCKTCGEIFEVSPTKMTTREDLLTNELYKNCQKCLQSIRMNQMKQIGDTFQSILMYCKNRNNGCDKELPSCDIHNHEINCEYRPEISFLNYRKHLEKMHQPYIKKVHLNEEYNVVIKAVKDHSVNVSSVVCDEKNQLYFTRKCSIDVQKDLFMVCVHYIGERENAKKYLYKVKINQGIESANAFYEYTAYCGPFVEIPNSPDAHSNCVLLHPKKLFLNDDYLNELKYSVTIKRIKERTESN